MNNETFPSQDQLEEMADDYVASSKVDYIALWEISGRLKYEFAIDNPDRLKSAVLSLIIEMLKRGLEPVNFEASSHDPVPWQEKDTTSIVARLSAEWDALGGKPSVNDIAWFNKPTLNA